MIVLQDMTSTFKSNLGVESASPTDARGEINGYNTRLRFVWGSSFQIPNVRPREVFFLFLSISSLSALRVRVVLLSLYKVFFKLTTFRRRF